MTSDSVISQKLAIDGGPKAATNKRVGWPQFAEEGIKAVEQVLRSGKVNYWTGPRGMEFEKRFAQWQGSKFAISTATGTSALHVALSALGIGPGDEVIVPSYTFIATSFAVVQAGAIPRFADVNLEDHCLSVESAEKLVTKRTKAVMPVHLYGNVCDMDKINAFARKHNLFVIEDNAEAFGGSYKGKKTGTLSHIAGLSFCQNKTFTTGGEGGMVTTDDEDLAWEARSFRDHGYDVVYASAMNERPLIEALAAGIPPIALVHTSALPHWKQATAHAVVVAEFGEQVVVNDPAFPTMPQVVPREAFMLAWSEFDYLYAIVRPR